MDWKFKKKKKKEETLHFQQTASFDLNVSATHPAFKNMPAYKHDHIGGFGKRPCDALVWALVALMHCCNFRQQVTNTGQGP